MLSGECNGDDRQEGHHRKSRNEDETSYRKGSCREARTPEGKGAGEACLPQISSETHDKINCHPRTNGTGKRKNHEQ